MYGAGTSPSTDEMLTIRPRPWARMCGRTALVIRTRPKKLTSKTRWIWATELSSAAPAAPVPALLTRTSSRPNRSITRRTNVLNRLVTGDVEVEHRDPVALSDGRCAAAGSDDLAPGL